MTQAKASPYTYSTLPNGLRTVHVRKPGEVEYLGMVVNVGSRDESSECHGLAHFVEHTIFKGTSKRKSWHIVNRMESIGGELNAYTTKEETSVYTIFPRGALCRAAELLSDLVTASVFPEKELRKEREVVEDEISSYLDSPSESIFDDFDERIFAGSPMAHNILGSSKNIDLFSSAMCRQWLEQYYVPDNMVLFYCGPAGAERVYSTLLRYFGSLNHASAGNIRLCPEKNDVFNHTEYKGLHQSHTVAGVRIPGLHSEVKPVFALIANIIGGPGMNSLLNFEMREKRGLVYTVEASTALYSDCGILSIYFGCDHNDEKKCRAVLDSTILRMADTTTPLKLERAKKQFIGQLALSRQNTENIAISAGRQTLYLGKVESVEESLESIKAIDIVQFRYAASEILPDKMSFLTFR